MLQTPSDQATARKLDADAEASACPDNKHTANETQAAQMPPAPSTACKAAVPKDKSSAENGKKTPLAKRVVALGEAKSGESESSGSKSGESETEAPAAGPQLPAAGSTSAVLRHILAAASAADSAQAPNATTLQAPGETRISALRIHGTQSIDMVAEGEVELQRDALTLTADRLTYRDPTDEVVAEGNVRLRQGDSAELSGPSASLIVGMRTGEFVEPKYSMSRERPPSEEGGAPRRVSGSGQADLIRLEGENQYRARNATWSTCAAPPDWYIKAGDLELDYDREIGTARDSTVVFKEVPFFWLPWAEFPLVGQRHSGLLPPTMEQSTKTGFGLTLPYYWNIAPNYDMTLTPRYMSRRGVQMGAEARYLGATYNGTMRGEYLPHDRISGESRSLGALQHRQWLLPSLYASLDLNAVSDDAYFEDLSTRVSMSSKVNLLREARLIYTGGGWWNASLLAQSYQTLLPDPEDPDPVKTPYRRLPQVALNATRAGEFRGLIGPGLDLGWQSEFVRFTHPDADRANASRWTAYPQVSLPLRWPGFYITPKIGVHLTRYDIEREQAMPDMREQITRSAPIFSLDTGLTFERQTSLFGRDYAQTLEPRLYYLKVPYRRQDDIPLFDTSRYDFGFAQIFSENLYTGGDRIADANQITATITTRLIDSSSGTERLRVLLGQRYYFDDQRVTLNYTDELGSLQDLETPRTSKRADMLLGLGTRVGRHSMIESLWQYNPRDYRTERYTATWRYNPSHARAFNISYRYEYDILRDIDISGQWPLWGQWHGVARLTHSLKDKRLTEAIAGLEYNGGCWVLRMGGHRYATREDEYNNSYFLQLELNDFTSIGTGGNVVNMIKRSVPGYGKINESSADQSFGYQ
ncbi:MAG: LPS-assembly protein LptD [Azoarcus sp.]|nr:LPS-assembly protein LptD [Azoarcus sp.]